MATNNSWNSASTTQYAVQVGNATGEIDSISTGTSGQVLQSGGGAANPAWSTATFPATAVTGDILYASGANTWDLLAPGTNGQVLTMGASVPAWSTSTGGVSSVTGTVNQITASPTTGAVILSTPNTFVAPGSVQVTSGFTVSAGAITFTPFNASGILINSNTGVLSSYATTNHTVQLGNSSGQLTSLTIGTNGQVLLGSTNANPSFVTPTAGTGLSITTNATTLSYALSTPVSIANGGTNATSMTNTDGVVYYDGTSLVTTAVGSTGQLLQMGASTPGWTTATYPTTTTLGDIYYASANNVISALPAGTPGDVLTMGASIPGWAPGGGSVTLVADDTNTASGSSITITGGGYNVISTSGNNASTLTFNTPNITINGGINGNTGNVGIGFGTATISGTNPASGSNNLVVIGYEALGSTGGAGGTNDQNVIIGAFAAQNASPANESIIRSVVIGYLAGQAIASTDNTFIGSSAGQLASTGGSLTIVGGQAGRAITTEGNCDLFGYSAGRALQGSGGFNQCFGNYSGFALTTGSHNVLIGQTSGGAYTTESGNVILGNVNGVAAENNVMRLGNDGTGGNYATPTAATFIAGIAGVTIANTAAVLIDTTTGQLGTLISSRKYKDNITPLNDFSSVILRLNPVKFTFKDKPQFGQQVGLIAEEVHEVMPFLVNYKNNEPDSVRYHDLPILLLNELKKLRAEVNDLKAQLGRA